MPTPQPDQPSPGQEPPTGGRPSPAQLREAAEEVAWFRRPAGLAVPSGPSGPVRPSGLPDLSGGVLNTCFAALDRHVVAGRAEEVALVHLVPGTGTAATLTYAQLLDLVARFGGVLRELGAGPGDRVLVALPAGPQAVVAMLACARVGAVHVVVPADLPAAALAARVDATGPAVVVAASCTSGTSGTSGTSRTSGTAGTVERPSAVQEALALAERAPRYVVVVQHPQAPLDLLPGRDVAWAAAMRPGGVPPAECVPLAAGDPLYLLPVEEGAAPEGPAPEGLVLREHGEHAVELAWWMRSVVGCGPGDLVLGAGDLAGHLGHSGAVYGPLLAGATSVLLEGAGRLGAGELGRLAAAHSATVLTSAPPGPRR